MFGVVTSLGLGVMQLETGLADIMGITPSLTLKIALIAGITACATLSVMAGLNKGAKLLSDVTIIGTLIMLGFMIIAGLHSLFLTVLLRMWVTTHHHWYKLVYGTKPTPTPIGKHLGRFFIGRGG